MIPITVIVSVKNEEVNLPFCLKNLKDFSEVIVVDSQSTDKTPEIVKNFGYRLINFKWNGKYPKKRNWTLDNVKLQNTWILFLDADEFITPSFKNEISKKILKGNKNGYWIYYDNYFMGSLQKYGLKMKKLALFKKGFGKYEKIEEDFWTNLDMEVHEHPIIKGGVGVLKNSIIHKDFKNLEHYIERHNAYSTWEAHRFLNYKKHLNSKFNFRQKIKYFLINTGLLPIAYFLLSYIFLFGFLDGVKGFYFAVYKSYYFFQVQTKIKLVKKFQ